MNYKEIAEDLLDELQEARHDIEAWAAYAYDYFQQKHDLAGTLKHYDEVIKKHAEALQK